MKDINIPRVVTTSISIQLSFMLLIFFVYGNYCTGIIKIYIEVSIKNKIHKTILVFNVSN